MNFRKICKNTKALSPVVASIILIAVTVAVSIAVAVWMGGLAGNFMQTEQVTMGQPTFDVTAHTATFTLKNTGTTAVTISDVYINSVSASGNVTTPTGFSTSGLTLQPNTGATSVTVSIVPLAAGNNYLLKVVTAKSNSFTVTGIA
jgi:archaeal type IV pilus assembly protein PilA